MDLLFDDRNDIAAQGVDVQMRLAAQNQEGCLLASQTLHMHHEFVDANAETNHQIGILKHQLGCMGNNISCIANRLSHHFM